MRGKKAKAIRKYIYRGQSQTGTEYIQDPESADMNKVRAIQKLIKLITDPTERMQEAVKLNHQIVGWGTVYATGLRRQYQDAKRLLKHSKLT